MNPQDFQEPDSGHLVPTIQGCQAFVPAPLPPPLLDLEPLIPQIASATRALGELSGVGQTLPNPYLLIRPFMRKEAVASSRIEGTVTTLSELFVFEAAAGEVRTSQDTREVYNYVRALEHALRRLKDLPVSLRLIREIHKILMAGVAQHRGANIVPGEFKTDQNWIGARLIQNARYVPPPPKESDEAMAQLEKYIHSADTLPLIIRLALIHYQFEAIHPFPDGNGRVGRLLIPLLLCEHKEMSQPLLYMSSYFERNYDEYIDRMLDISTHGLWERWIEFFLAGIEQSCRDAIRRATAILKLKAEYHEKVQRARSSALLAQIIDNLFEVPAITVSHAADQLGIAYNAAKNNIAKLVGAGILQESPEDRRPKVYVADQIIGIINSEESFGEPSASAPNDGGEVKRGETMPDGSKPEEPKPR